MCKLSTIHWDITRGVPYVYPMVFCSIGGYEFATNLVFSGKRRWSIVPFAASQAGLTFHKCRVGRFLLTVFEVVHKGG